MKHKFKKSDFLVIEVRGLAVFEGKDVTYGLGIVRDDNTLMALAFPDEENEEYVLLLGGTPDLEKLYEDVLDRIRMGMTPVIARIPENETVSITLYNPVHTQPVEC